MVNDTAQVRLPKCKACGYVLRKKLEEKDGQWWFVVHCAHPHIVNDPAHSEGLSVRQAYRKGRCSTLCPLINTDGD